MPESITVLAADLARRTKDPDFNSDSAINIEETYRTELTRVFSGLLTQRNHAEFTELATIMDGQGVDIANASFTVNELLTVLLRMRKYIRGTFLTGLGSEAAANLMNAEEAVKALLNNDRASYQRFLNHLTE